jgi:hypothetical protein
MARPDVFIAEYLVLLGRNAAACAEFRANKELAMKCFGLTKEQRDHIRDDSADDLGKAILAEFAETGMQAAGPVVTSMTTKVTQ